MDGDCGVAEDFDCPSLLCEELDSETKNYQGKMGRRRKRRERQEEEKKKVFSQREDEQQEEKNENKVMSEKERMVTEGEEEEQVKPESGLEAEAEEAQEVQMEDNKIESTKETGIDKQESKLTKSLELKDEQKKSRKKRGKKQSEQVRNRRGGKDVSERCEEEEEKEEEEEEEKKSQIQEVPAMSSEESSTLTETSIGLMNSCDLSDPLYVGFGGTGLYCPSVPIPLLYSSQPPVPIQPPPPQPHGPKRPHSPLPPHSLPQQAPQPLEMEITQVYSTRRSIRYSTRGRGRALSFNLLPGLETVDPCLLPPAPKKKTRTLYNTDQIEHLEALFQEDHYPDAEKRKVIAASVGVTPQRITVWFQNRRAKWRKVRAITAKAEHKQSQAEYRGHSPCNQINPTLPTLAPNSKGVPSFSGRFATKLSQLAPAAPSFPTLSTQTPPSYGNPLASVNSPGQFRARDGGQHQLSSQGGLTDYHPRPMHSPPPLRRASLPLFTTTYNPTTPPLLNTPASTPPLFLDTLEGGSSLAHRDTPSLQTDTSSLFDFVEKLDYLSSSQQSNTLSYQLQTSSYPSSQPQHQPQAPLSRMAYLTPSPYLTPNPPDSNSFMTIGPGGNSTGMMTYSSGSHTYFQSQSSGQILLQSTGHHGGIAAYQSYPWGNMYNQPAVHQRAQCPPPYPASLGSARDQQTPSTTSVPLPSFFPQGDHGPSNSQRSLHPQTHSSTTTSSTTTILPPVLSLRPSCLRAENTPTKISSLLPPQVSSDCPESPPMPPCVKMEYDSPREIHSHFHCDFSPIHF